MIRATSRCRVDFGGGTLDIWPIGILHPGSVTVNVAVDLSVTVELARRASGYLVRQSGAERFAATVPDLLAEPETALVGHVVAAFDLPPLEVTVESASPRGAGLGASSALTVSLLAAAEQLVDGGLRADEVARAAVARDLEARLMGLPTGSQDHLPAQLGGAIALEHRPGGERVRRLAVDLETLADHLLVAYSGQSHFSAGNNWQVIRRRLEGDAEVAARLEEIAAAARAMPAALEAGDWSALGALVGQEWRARRELAAEIDTPVLARLLAAAAAQGAWGGKACGAGGGGCVVALMPAAARRAVADAWTALGATLLAARPTASGLELAT